MPDAGLRKLFSDHLIGGHWQSIESGSTGKGIPDQEYCFPKNKSGWIEHKQTSANAVKIDPEQVGWIERRVRMGGRVFLAVRKRCAAGPRREAADELHLFYGRDIRAVFLQGLNGATAIGRWPGGPAKWDWNTVKKVITA